MATTAGGTPYVESSDLVADYPTVSLALAEHIDDLPAAVLQIVRATDTTDRSTTSATFVDVTGMSVTITPQKSDSAILILCFFSGQLNTTAGFRTANYQITDSSDNAISGASNAQLYSDAEIILPISLLAYATPATTSAVTYKLRFSVQSPATNQIRNSSNSVGQLYAIEVSA